MHASPSKLILVLAMFCVAAGVALASGASLAFLSSTPTMPSPSGRAIVVRDTLGYCTAPGGFEVLNLARPESASVVSYLTTPGITRSLDLNYPHVYVADDYNGLVIADVSDPLHPVITGTSHESHDAYSVGHWGTTVYVGSGEDGLLVFDVSNPAAPELKATVPIGILAQGLEVHYPYLYLAASDEYVASAAVVVFSIAAPSAPVELGRLTWTDGNPCRNLAVRDSILYACFYASGAQGGNLRVVDVADPAHPREIGSVATPGGAAVYDALVPQGDTLAYLVAFTRGLYVIGMADPSRPESVAILKTGRFQAEGACIRDSLVYVLHGYLPDGMAVVDVADPAHPSVAARLSCGDMYYDLAERGKYAYAARLSQGIEVLDVSDPSRPAVVDSGPGEFVRYLVTAADRLFATNDGDAAPAFQIWSLDGSGGLTLAGSSDTIRCSAPPIVNGSLAYCVGAIRNVGQEWLVVMNVADPANVRLVGKAYCQGFSYGLARSYDARYVYVSQYLQLRTFDVSDSLLPVQVSSCSLRGSGTGVLVSDTIAYVADYNAGITVLNIVDPRSPRVVGSYVHPSHNEALEVAAVRDHVVVANGTSGVYLLNAENPLDLVLEDEYDTPFLATRVTAVNDSVVAVTDGASIQFLSIAGLGVADGYGGVVAHGNSLFVKPGRGRITLTVDVDDTNELVALVVDITGRPVASIALPYEGMCRRSTVWAETDRNGRRLAAGIYMVIVKARNHVLRAKISLIH